MDYVCALQVASLLDRMESLQNKPLHINIHTALNRHHMAISITQARRKEEIANISKHRRQRANITEDRGKSFHSGRHMCLFPSAACPNMLLFHRHPVVGHCTEGPRCYHKEAPHSPVGRSPDNTTETCQEAGPRC